MANNYIPYYLKFASQEEADQVLTAVNYLRTYEETDPDTGEATEVRTFYTVGDIPGGIDIVGEIWNDDGVYETDEETGEITVVSEPTKKDGWHVNIILASDLPEELQEFVVEPVTPNRRFAGF